MDLKNFEQLRAALMKFAQTLTDDEAMEIPTVYPAYKVNTPYKTGQRITYGTNGVGDPQLYKILQDHTSLGEWKPDVTPSLYEPIGLTTEGYVIWAQPSGAHDCYNTGDIVSYEGTLKVSLIDGNVWLPTTEHWADYTTE